jgi:hypothetical protein
MSATRTQSSLPDTSELVEGVLFYPIALVVSATIFPGFILCIPGLLFVTVLVLVPLAAIGLVLAAVAAVVMAPFALVRAVRALRERHSLESVGRWLSTTATRRPPREPVRS